MKISASLRTFGAAVALALALAPAALAQDTPGTTSTSGPARSAVPSGQKSKIKGFVVSRGSDSFVVQDAVSGAQTTVVLNDQTSVKTKGGFFGGGSRQGLTAI